MSNLNTKFYERTAIMAAIAPQSTNTTVNSGWVSMANVHQIVGLIQTGVLGTSATVDAKFQQATDSSGTGAKDITGKALVQIVKATGDNKLASIEVRDTELDTNNGFAFVQLSITVGTAASLVGAQVLGSLAVFQPATLIEPASVVQHVG